MVNLTLNGSIYIYLPIERIHDLYHLLAIILEQFPHIAILFVAGSIAWVMTVLLYSLTLLSAALAEQQQG